MTQVPDLDLWGPDLLLLTPATLQPTVSPAMEDPILGVNTRPRGPKKPTKVVPGAIQEKMVRKLQIVNCKKFNFFISLFRWYWNWNERWRVSSCQCPVQEDPCTHLSAFRVWKFGGHWIRLQWRKPQPVGQLQASLADWAVALGP